MAVSGDPQEPCQVPHLLVCVLCEPSSGPGACLGKAGLQGGQGDEDGFLGTTDNSWGRWLLVPAQFHSLATPKVPGEAMSRFGVALLLSVRVAARSLPLGRGVLVLWWVCVAGRLSVLR